MIATASLGLRATLGAVPRRQFHPNEVSAGGVVARVSPEGAHEVCLVSDGHYWGLPKGNVERDEKPEQTAVREIAEETGLPPDRLELVSALPASEYVYKRGGRLIFKRVHCFLVLAPWGVELVPQAGEIEAAEWLSWPEARARASFADTVRALVAAEEVVSSLRGATL
jgi:8-oxo-dGTP pyrophosphatase MutT (NUDIX family)